MMSRGFTLIETLLATVVLAAATAACAGLITSARRSLETPRKDIGALSEFANEFMEDPESFGVDPGVLYEGSIGSIDVATSQSGTPSLVSVACLKGQTSEGETAEAAYLVFRSADGFVVRFMPLPEESN